MGVKLRIVQKRPSPHDARKALRQAMDRYGISPEDMVRYQAVVQGRADLLTDYRAIAEAPAPDVELKIVARASLTYVVMRGELEIAEFENEDNARVFRDAIKKGESDADRKGTEGTPVRTWLARIFGR